MSDQTFLVGTGGKNIFACRLTSKGQLQLLTENKSGKGPSWLLAQNNLLYAVNEHDNKIETFTIDDRTQGKLTSKKIVSSKGNTPCSLALDATGKWLAVANYGDDGPSNIVLLPLDASHLPDEQNAQVASIDGHGPNKARQDHSHCHQVQFHQGYLYVNDLGTDTITAYHYDETTGELRVSGDRVKTQPGAGPRHLLFHPDQPLAFVANELDCTTDVYRSDAAAGTLERQQTIPTREKDAEKNSTKGNTSAEIHFTPDKKYLLVSNRGDDNIVVYTLNDDKDQVLTVKNHFSIHGSGPRYFTFDPTGNFLLVTNQNSNNVTCFSYKQGNFEFISQLANVESPQHLVFLQ